MTCPTCQRQPPLCESCLGQHLTWNASAANRIGHAWARAVRAVMPDQRWPAYDASAKIRAIAARKVERLAAGDAQLRDGLARICAAAAAYHYDHDTPVPGTISFRVGRRRPSGR